MITGLIGAAVITTALAASPEARFPVEDGVVLSGVPGPGRGLDSAITSGFPLPNNAGLLNMAPYAEQRPATVTYSNSGRLFVPSTAADKIAASLYPSDPTRYGASVADGNAAIFVEPSSEPTPAVMISPWQTINQDTWDRITRRRPWLNRSQSRTDVLLDELRYNQNRWLRHHGFIKQVRTHVNPAALAQMHREVDAGQPEPSGIMHLRKMQETEDAEPMRASLPSDGAIIRVSMPTITAPVTVIRPNEEPEVAEADSEETQG